MRPPLKPDDPGYDLIPQRFRESTCEVPSPTNLVVQSHQGKKPFIFDHVFDENATQQDIWGYVSDSVNSFVQGYNVSILAYGQSGAGKSFTMGTSGPEEQDDMQHMGIVPRAARTLFERLGIAPARPASGLRTPKRYSTHALPTLSGLAQNSTADKDWTLKATYVEIYNEQLRDLLLPESVPQADRATVAIREDTKGRILLTGLTQIEINTAEDVLAALNFGSTIRQTDATAINARSSRSHAVFSLQLIQKKADSAPTMKRDKRMSVPESMASGENIVTLDSKLHFVDLAGSERLKNTGATGERAKEGISINAGLASLGKVISQLSSKSATSHVSYRDSRLTRLLQDSLGGNAITFMVACVTPASFHLNETLNTLDYARRARSIQSRPEIQQTHEDSDKQAAIDRLRAEVTFLRDQIKHSDRAGNRSSMAALSGRGERSGKKEAELQTQLMDMQESYNALNARHAKLISEIGKARDNGDTDTPMLKEAIGESAMERLKRSNSFAEAVEQVVLEYEKTIQSLETSLTNTRSSLSNTESSLLEKQTRIAYMETIQQQLQSRMQKAIDREQNNESYLRDLEARMEGSTTGEEKNASVISDLRKELARARENGTNAEDYINTLEERLAEAEQDQDIMQREIDRLEQVIERQRSIGRLDNLLSELDKPKINGVSAERAASPPPSKRSKRANGHADDYDPFRSVSDESDYEDEETQQPDQTRDEITALPTVASLPARSSSRAAMMSPNPRSPTQDDYMADKLENVTQELFDLRSEHEAVVTDYDNLQQKYQTALETLAKLEYDKETDKTSVTPSASRPESFLADAGMRREEKALQSGRRPSSSRSLLAELSSRGVSSTGDEEAKTPRKVSDTSDRLGMRDEIAVQDDAQAAAGGPLPDEDAASSRQEFETLKRLHSEKEVSMHELTKNYKSLAEKHKTTLQQVDDLRQELQRVHHMRPGSRDIGRPTSPALGSPGFKQVLRRKSDDLLMGGSDRASRGFASLKNIALDNFEHNPDLRQNFELNLNTVMVELHGRSERVHSLEAELTTVRKELEGKQAIIAGLTRERSSMNAGNGNIDFSVVGQMRDQLQQSEEQIRVLHEQHSAREKEFSEQIDHLKNSLEEHQRNATAFAGGLMTPRDDSVPGGFPEEPMFDRSDAGPGASRSLDTADVTRLQSELAAWETKHNSAMDGMKASESRLLNTISELEASLRSAEERAAPQGLGISTDSIPVSDHEREKHQQIVDALQRQVDDHKATAQDHVSKLEQLEQSYSRILAQVDEDSKTRDLTEKDLSTHRDLVANLENQLEMHKSTIALHQESLEKVQATHAADIEQLKASMASSEEQSKERSESLETQHKEAADNLQKELTRVQGEHTALLAAAAAALGSPTDSSKLHTQIQALVDEGKDVHTRHVKTTNDLKNVQEELQNSLAKSAELEGKIGELKALHEEAELNLKKISDREKKSSRLVEELEEQLNTNFDSHRATNNRLSRMEATSVQARQEMEKELEELKLRNSMLEVSLTGILTSVIWHMLMVMTAATHTAPASIHDVRSRLRQLQPRVSVP